MKIQLVRNATLRLSVAGVNVLVDPFLAPAFSRPSYTGRSANPLVGLPLPAAEILRDVDLVVVSHLHSDHFDPEAQQAVPKDLPILCQPGDEAEIAAMGFVSVTPLESRSSFGPLTFTLQEASHGLGPAREKMGGVMGFLLQAPEEPTLYWAGDTVFCPAVAGNVLHHRPEIIVTHSCGALWDGDLIVMDAAETLLVAALAPWATIVATHMEALDHATVDRAGLRAAGDAAGVAPERLRIPADGETLAFDIERRRRPVRPLSPRAPDRGRR